FDRPRARADRSNDRAADQDRQTAAENHDLATIALLDAEERRAWLRHSCEVRGALIEKPRRDRLTDGKVYAADQCAVLSCKGHKRAAGIDDSDIVAMPMLAAFASPASSIRLASDNAKVMDERGIVLVASLDPDFIRSDQASVTGMTTSAGISEMKGASPPSGRCIVPLGAGSQALSASW